MRGLVRFIKYSFFLKMGGSMPIISCENAVKVYASGEVTVEALKGVSLTIEKGEMVGVMGPSGCGKTTLLNCLSGIDDVTSGTIIVDGQDLTKMDDDSRTDFRAKHMGFIFQFYNLLPVLTAAENVELSMLLAGVNPREARKRAETLLETVGLGGRMNQRPASLSGGERQRVTIARALANEPAIVWADEPTGDLDRATSQSIMELMRSLNREKGQTFVIVTHDPEIGTQCDRIIHMRDGRIVEQGECN